MTRKSGWGEALAVYRHPRVVAILFLGFSSGLPLALTVGTLSLWLAEVGVTNTTIGLFALAGTPYTFKFLWSPLVDRMPIPFLTRWFGRRRGWALATQLALVAAIVGLGNSDPAVAPMTTALFALITAFCSASQDIVIDAYRVEILEERQFGAGAAMIVLGYRLGMLVSGAGALYLATAAGWQVTYLVMAALVGVGILAILLNPEPEASVRVMGRASEAEPIGIAATRPAPWSRRLMASLKLAVIDPFAEFLRRPGWGLVLLFILLYKFGDALAGVMSNPFYLDLGFSKIEIANVSKVFGLTATIVGSALGGVLVSRIGIMRSLWYGGLLQMGSNLTFVLLAEGGRDLTYLTLAIAIENISGGLGTAAFVAYLSALCHVAYTATQYALLSSFMAFGRTLLASGGGWLSEQMPWSDFFWTTAAAALPGLLLLLWMRRRYPPDAESV
ncbi:MAG: AmpG family muropeptide MFS transporter [Magnetococcales bacterium]|nr:AmpG family muropeptide MFS transporter [Magnetococcales bacterium]MBF0155843.1 AmpG family muropeptide MFS transporter [Magnetococcales bacterium]